MTGKVILAEKLEWTEWLGLNSANENVAQYRSLEAGTVVDLSELPEWLRDKAQVLYVAEETRREDIAPVYCTRCSFHVANLWPGSSVDVFCGKCGTASYFEWRARHSSLRMTRSLPGEAASRSL